MKNLLVVVSAALAFTSVLAVDDSVKSGNIKDRLKNLNNKGNDAQLEDFYNNKPKEDNDMGATWDSDYTAGEEEDF